MSNSILEQQFLMLLKTNQGIGIPQPVREYRFMPERKWKFDFAWPKQKLAVEIEGGIWTRGGHTTGKGYIANCDKYNHAVLKDWYVLRFTSNHLNKDPLEIIYMVRFKLGIATKEEIDSLESK